MPERHYGLVIASLVAVVAIVGLMLNFSGFTGALITPDQYIGTEGRWHGGGEQFAARCHADLDALSEELGVLEDGMSENECCKTLCGQLCEGMDDSCYAGCDSGCDLGRRKAYGYV